MQKLGVNKQVFAVTHLAQVAAYANTHFVVQKKTYEQNDKTTTASQVIALDEPLRIAEIARMIGGEAQSQTSLAHANTMLKSAQQCQLL